MTFVKIVTIGRCSLFDPLLYLDCMLYILMKLILLMFVCGLVMKMEVLLKPLKDDPRAQTILDEYNKYFNQLMEKNKRKITTRLQV